MIQVTGIRDGHRVIITVTRPNGTNRIERRHHPECPCHKPVRRKPTTR